MQRRARAHTGQDLTPDADFALRYASCSPDASMRPSSWPFLTVCPTSASVDTIEPATCARTVALSSASSDPDIAGPFVTEPSCAIATFSVPTTSC